MNKNWYGKKRLKEQLKFFGAKKVRFISCYAKKPRIRMSNKKTVDTCDYMVKSAVERGSYISGLIGSGANAVYLAQMAAQQQAMQIQQKESTLARQHILSAQNANLCGLSGSLGLFI